MDKARKVYEQFVQARENLGREALQADFDRAVVVLGKPYNTHDPGLNLFMARHLERLGLPAIPWDCLALSQVVLSERWDTLPWHYSREQLRALEFTAKYISKGRELSFALYNRCRYTNSVILIEMNA
ncbi:MAG: hypothetical protein ISS70_26085 [Phycisphaerae bacterium]|nr:hypothetical protein [Phycisphaerae bacterium]